MADAAPTHRHLSCRALCQGYTSKSLQEDPAGQVCKQCIGVLQQGGGRPWPAQAAPSFAWSAASARSESRSQSSAGGSRCSAAGHRAAAPEHQSRVRAGSDRTLYGRVRYPLCGGCRSRPMQPMGSRQLTPKGMRCNKTGGLYGGEVRISYGPGIAGGSFRFLYRKSGGLVTSIGP